MKRIVLPRVLYCASFIGYMQISRWGLNAVISGGSLAPPALDVALEEHGAPALTGPAQVSSEPGWQLVLPHHRPALSSETQGRRGREWVGRGGGRGGIVPTRLASKITYAYSSKSAKFTSKNSLDLFISSHWMPWEGGVWLCFENRLKPPTLTHCQG